MQVAQFEKVSYQQFEADMMNCQDAWRQDYNIWAEDRQDDPHANIGPYPYIQEVYDNIELPKRATTGSAGYDFKAPFSFKMEPGQSVKFPTGVRCKIDDGWFLALFPRSSLGFKYRMQLDNGTGIVDSDYYNAANEGHIHAKFTNDSKHLYPINGLNALPNIIDIKRGDSYMQGIFIPFGVTYDDNATGIRTGGFGSTNKQ